MKISIEDLLKIAESNEETLKEAPQKAINDVHRFILALKIKEGKNSVTGQILYKAYKSWSANPVHIKTFYHLFSEFFPSHPGSKIYYLLNLTPVELLNKIDNLKLKI